jgi:hypothetical protein
MSRGLPIAVPCSVKGGCSGSAGGEDLAIDAGGVGGGGGGRRDAEKSGRSRVAESELMGIRDRGLPCGGGCRSPGFSAAVSCGPAISPVSSEPLALAKSSPRGRARGEIGHCRDRTSATPDHFPTCRGPRLVIGVSGPLLILGARSSPDPDISRRFREGASSFKSKPGVSSVQTACRA